MSNTQGKIYAPGLDFIKTMAIILIVAFHFFGELSGWHRQIVDSAWFLQYWQNPDLLKIIKFIESYFYLGVNLFVIASGFGLYFSYLHSDKNLNLKGYFQKRILRLIPPALLAIVVVFFIKGLFLGGFPIENWHINFFPFFGGLNLFSDIWFYPPINGETWFLGLIIQLYLFFPLLVKLLKKVGENKFLWILFGISVFFRIIYFLYFKNTVATMSYGLFAGRIFEFGFGMIVAKNFFEKKPLPLAWFGGILLFFGYFYAFTFPFSDSIIGIAVFTLFWHLASKIKLRNLSKNIAAQSYMIFLIHHPLVWIAQKYFPHDAWSLKGFFTFVILFIGTYFIAKILNLSLKIATEDSTLAAKD